jgi:4-amino-4-deoxy-L-arabinose transferase-like glycosyltransferase
MQSLPMKQPEKSRGQAPPQPAAGGPATALPPSVPRALWWILLAGLVVRAMLWVWFLGEPLDVHDERDYNALAVHLVEQGRYTLDGEQLTSIRPPLYPAFVAAVYRVAGVENYPAVRAVQALLSLVAVWLLYLLGSEVYDRRTGLGAAGLFCFYPSLLGQNNLLLTEALFTFWLIAACLAAARFFRTESLAWLAGAGVLVGLASLTRAVLWLFPPVLALGLLVFWTVGFRRRLAAAAVLLAAFAVTLAPWAVRNTRLHETFVPIDVMGGRNLMMGNYEHTPLHRAWDAISIQDDRAWYRVLEREHPGYKSLTQGQKDKVAMRRGLRFMAEHPALTLQRSAVKFFNFWQLERSFVAGMARGHFGDPARPVILGAAAVIFGSYALAVFSGVFGVIVRPPPSRAMYWTLLALIVYVCALHTLVFAHSRYHLPLIPVLLIFSAAAVLGWREIWAERCRWRFWAAALVCAVLAGSWVYEVIAVDLARFTEAMS